MRLGCLNHALLTIRALQADNVNIIGWVANGIDPNMAYRDRPGDMQIAEVKPDPDRDEGQPGQPDQPRDPPPGAALLRGVGPGGGISVGPSAGISVGPGAGISVGPGAGISIGPGGDISVAVGGTGIGHGDG